MVSEKELEEMEKQGKVIGPQIVDEEASEQYPLGYKPDAPLWIIPAKRIKPGEDLSNIAAQTGKDLSELEFIISFDESDSELIPSLGLPRKVEIHGELRYKDEIYQIVCGDVVIEVPDIQLAAKCFKDSKTGQDITDIFSHFTEIWKRGGRVVAQGFLHQERGETYDLDLYGLRTDTSCFYDAQLAVRRFPIVVGNSIWKQTIDSNYRYRIQ